MLYRVIVVQEMKFLFQNFDFGFQGIQRKLVHHHEPGDFILESLEICQLQRLINQCNSPFLLHVYLPNSIRVYGDSIGSRMTGSFFNVVT